MWKQERQHRGGVVAKDILSSAHPDRMAAESGDAADVKTNPMLQQVVDEPLSPVAAQIRARGLAAVSAKRASAGQVQPSSAPAADDLALAEPAASPVPGGGVDGTAKQDQAERSVEDSLHELVPPFSIPTMRELFSHLDDEGTGKITKNQWLEFFRKSPSLRKMLLKDEEGGSPADEDDARIMRRLLRQLKDVDINKDGFIDWDEFSSYFHSCGYVLQSE